MMVALNYIPKQLSQCSRRSNITVIVLLFSYRVIGM